MRVGTLRKAAFAAAEQDRVDHQYHLVGQSLLEPHGQSAIDLPQRIMVMAIHRHLHAGNTCAPSLAQVADRTRSSPTLRPVRRDVFRRGVDRTGKRAAGNLRGAGSDAQGRIVRDCSLQQIEASLSPVRGRPGRLPDQPPTSVRCHRRAVREVFVAHPARSRRRSEIRSKILSFLICSSPIQWASRSVAETTLPSAVSRGRAWRPPDHRADREPSRPRSVRRDSQRCRGPLHPAQAWSSRNTSIERLLRSPATLPRRSMPGHLRVR